eukprot:2172009-Pleurochrysis_carterae.AAC.1
MAARAADRAVRPHRCQMTGPAENAVTREAVDCVRLVAVHDAQQLSLGQMSKASVKGAAESRNLQALTVAGGDSRRYAWDGWGCGGGVRGMC